MLALIQYIEGVAHLKCGHQHQPFRTIPTIRAFPSIMNYSLIDLWNTLHIDTGAKVAGTTEYFSHLVLFALRLGQGLQIRVTHEPFFLKDGNPINYQSLLMEFYTILLIYTLILGFSLVLLRFIGFKFLPAGFPCASLQTGASPGWLLFPYIMAFSMSYK